MGEPAYLSDGYCDHDIPGYNTAECGWDGGDCCEETCSTAAYACGTNDYICMDPNYSNNDVDDAEVGCGAAIQIFTNTVGSYTSSKNLCDSRAPGTTLCQRSQICKCLALT